jgi:hypothetical protein
MDEFSYLKISMPEIHVFVITCAVFTDFTDS